MKCVVTGHSSGIGQSLIERFKKDGWETVGMSQSNGYNIEEDIEKVLNDSKDCDLFINCASSNDAQLNLVKRLCLKVPKIVTFGSCGSDYTDIWGKKYSFDKQDLEKKCRLISLDNNSSLADMLFIKMAFAETTYSRLKDNRIDSDYTVSYDEIYETIKFWITNPKIRQIEFQFKLTNYTIQQIKKLSQYPDRVDDLLKEITGLVYE